MYLVVIYRGQEPLTVWEDAFQECSIIYGLFIGLTDPRAAERRWMSGKGGKAMELYQVRSFVAVSRLLNFARAAEHCNVTQPAMTKAVQKLEYELGRLSCDALGHC